MARSIKLQEIPTSRMAHPVVGYNLDGETLGELVSSEPTLVVFLRHFGCIFCKEMVGDLRQVVESSPDYPRVLFVAHGDVEFAEPFFASAWPEARCIVDGDRTLYHAFDVERMSKVQALNPVMLSCGLRAAGKGYMQSGSKGDPQQMPGLFYVYGPQVIWQHDFKHAGDHPDWRALPSKLPKAGQPAPAATRIEAIPA